MVWDIEYTNEFGEWWARLAQNDQEEIVAKVEL